METEVMKIKGNIDLTKYLKGKDYDQNVCIVELRHFLDLTIEGMVESGARILLIKEMEQHGDYMKILEDIGISQQRAHELMTIAIFWYERILPENLNHLKLGKSKMLLLSKLPDDIIDKEQIEEADKMTVSELRVKIQEQRRQIDNGKKQITRYQQRIDSYEEKIKKDPDFEKSKKWGEKVFEESTLLNQWLIKCPIVEAQCLNNNGAAYRAILDRIKIMVESINEQFEKIKKGCNIE